MVLDMIDMNIQAKNHAPRSLRLAGVSQIKRDIAEVFFEENEFITHIFLVKKQSIY